MLFSSISFLYIFLPILLLVYFILPKKLKNGWLLIASLTFYAFDNPSLLLLLIPCILLAYINGFLIYKWRNKVHFFFAILLEAMPLIYFKYTNFFIENANNLLGLDIKLLKLVLPLGISFYTFQIISYLADVWMGNSEYEKNFINLALYVVCFPQLIAGPIVIYTDFNNQLKNKKISLENFNKGILTFMVGLGQKVLLANQLGELCSKYVVGDSTILFTWMYMIAYSLQIYFDFCGYSKMAIGLGRMIGFEFPQNFNYPFIAHSIQNFWTRWHMTLSGWFREYVYIPLGGSRCSTLKNIRNLFVVWAFTGFWHGAAWNFIIWGLLFFVLLVVEKYIIKGRINKHLYRVITLLIVAISFLIFSQDDLGNLGTCLVNLVSGTFVNDYTLFYLRNFIGVIIIAIIGSTPLMYNLYVKYVKDKKIAYVFESIFIVVILLLSTAYLIDGSFNPFLYFRF